DIGVFSAGEAFTPGDICTDEELIDLTLQDADILQDQDSDEYGVTYFTSEEDAINGENPILNPEEFELEDPGCTTFYARVQNAEVDIDADGFEECFDITSFEVCQVEVGELEDLEECDDGEGTAIFDLTENENSALNGLD